ncbi:MULTISPECIES: aldo/keto reductase [Paenibacillus]|uniref:Aldo/keto reductase n=2 Tax=Paenibacillus TaxID=44249 RepID=A0ABX2ZFE1_PAEPO|nr:MULTISPECIES: aldo/keto reductase [Paenibacillus]APB75848.1 aldo/keto reductase [Paenibacillus polymyxa]ODA10221.1 aldo/keto reductase [Paenibacillus polymyxa]OME69109.1 aldo/keto reductase [Paenibacillus peoriae]OMF29969.1 aldo/keto reductase [Paenibacillus peoriae]POR28536.1 aldo/keto reductase [Paenibacillus polymyxa]
MNYRTVGKTGIKVSNLCFGTMSFGGNADEETSKKMFNRSREAGINFFDTANVYSQGRSEEILGECIEDCRNEIVLSTKVFYPMGQDVNARGLSRRHIMLEVENSLRRLKTDRIDFYFVHMFDENTPMEETLRALDDLQAQGKILYPAVSNWSAWQIAKAVGISAREELARFELIQPMYNLVKRQAEVEILPLAASEQIGVISYSPLGAGILTGKYGTNKRPEQGRLVEEQRYTDRYADEMNFAVADRFTAHAAERGVKPSTLAVAWAMSNPMITAPIIGARNLAQLEDSLGAVDVEMTPEWRDEISRLSVTPAPATDRGETLLPNWA